MFKGSSVILKAMSGFLLLLVVSSFGFAYFHTQSMSATDVPVSGCPFMNEGTAVLCTMSPLEHIEEWQHMFLAIPVAFALFLCVAVLTFALPFLYSTNRLLLRRFQFNFSPPYTNGKPLFQSYIQAAFSSGILNPKLF